MVDVGSHCRFNLRCLDCGFIPVSCRLKNPISTPNSYKIIGRAEIQLLHESQKYKQYIEHVQN